MTSPAPNEIGTLLAQRYEVVRELGRGGMGVVYLCRDAVTGDRVALIYPTCAEFFYTFFGALRLGAIPVPLYPTLGVDATASVFNNSGAAVVATIGWFRSGVEASVAKAPGVRSLLEPVDLDVAAPPPRVEPAGPDDLAFLQYTSGSTAEPRGVMLTHQNVVQTIRFMSEAAGLDGSERVVSWLPLYHDMGLIGCAFTPPLTGTPLWLLPPDLRNPRQWLELITEIRLPGPRNDAGSHDP